MSISQNIAIIMIWILKNHINNYTGIIVNNTIRHTPTWENHENKFATVKKYDPNYSQTHMFGGSQKWTAKLCLM